MMLIASYAASLIVLGTSSSILTIWLALETNMIFFIIIINITSTEFETNSNLAYFLIQSIASFLLLISCFYEKSVNEDVVNWIISGSLAFNIALIPFHIWIYNIINSMSNFSFILLLTAQNMPILILAQHLTSSGVIILLILSIAIGSLFLINSKSIYAILVSSSIYGTFWIMIILGLSIWSFLEVYAIYTLTNIVILTSEGAKINTQENANFMICIIFLMGLPPFSIFFWNIYSLKIISSSMSFIILGVVWMCTFVSTIGYLNQIINIFNINMTEGVYSSINESSGAKQVIIIMVLYSLTMTM